MADSIHVTEELLDELWAAQLRHTKSLIEDALKYGGTGDDGHDYLDSALELSTTMEMLRFDRILSGPGSLDSLLNSSLPPFDYQAPMTTLGVPDNPGYYQADEDFTRDNGFPHLAMLACDGVAPEFYDLDCPALPKAE